MRLFLLLLLIVCAPVSAEGWEGVIRLDEGDKRGLCEIRSQTEYIRFVNRIPKERLQMKQPAPPSTDPLLLKPPVDFSRHSLIAIWSHNVHIDCKIRRTERDGDDLIVHTAFDAPSDYRNYAAPDGYGQYHLVLVDTFPGQARLGEINKKAPGDD